MILDSQDQRRLALANELALAWHGEQKRKGSDIPYMSHLSQVKGLVLEHGGSVDQAVAGLLHDALEDAPSPEERARRETVIRDEFGQPVLDIVLDCTDTTADEAAGSKAPWRQRKERYLAHLSELSKASSTSLLVAACDKRHNLFALVWDVKTAGPGYLERFNAQPTDQLWYFREFVAAVGTRVPDRLKNELDALVEDFRTLVEE
jgi:(p)ppGpp synthase/HD superfamily hydrolase